MQWHSFSMRGPKWLALQLSAMILALFVGAITGVLIYRNYINQSYLIDNAAKSRFAMDDRMSGQYLFQAAAVCCVLFVVIVTLIWSVRWLAEKPRKSFIAGIGTLEAGDFGFRFPTKKKIDEITLAENSLNKMASRIQSQRKELGEALVLVTNIIEFTADLIFTLNQEKCIQTFNRGAEETLGFSRKDAVGRRMETLFVVPEDCDHAFAMLEDKDNLTNWETRFTSKDGQVRHILLTLSRLRDSKGYPVGTLGIGKDITLEKDLSKQLFEAEKAAAIGQALTAIQHSIKNMLNTMTGGLYLARVGIKNDKQTMIHEGCTMIDEGLQCISDLSRNMLKYAKGWVIEPEPVNLSEMTNKLVIALSQTAIKRGITIETNIDELPQTVFCDPRLIHMCLMDIVSNAMDACIMKEYGPDEHPNIILRLYAALEDRGVAIETRDNGIGMTKEVLENIFTPFFTTKKKSGTGLGLALTSRLIDLHQGKLEIESEPGIGSLFRITLPNKGREKATRETS